MGFLQDWSIPDIKRELIRKEIPTMKGGKVWGTKNIKYMLQNPTYTGNKVARLHSYLIYLPSIKRLTKMTPLRLKIPIQPLLVLMFLINSREV
ncbi:recombinase family protein [Anaerobacillus sp. HL2]|nr:recombinase family protein [Anaerobacillus sp. HL2]